MLATFSATLRDEVHLNTWREDLLSIVQETMQPACVLLWLRRMTDHMQQFPNEMEPPDAHTA
jgi:hypothetical protein